MFSQRVLRGVAAGEVTVAFRRWSSPQVRAWTRVSTPVGIVRVGEVREVDPDELTFSDAEQAGFRSLQGLRSSLDKHGAGRVYRVGLSFAGADRQPSPEPAVLGSGQRAEIDRWLARWDVSSSRGLWTVELLELVRDRPGARAAELAAVLARPVSRLKSDVWKLRELGLVESSGGGFGLTARGVAYIEGR
ncbi:hypothetical protein GCM10027563_27880 [Parasphingorhabdus pacifica]